MNENRPRGFRSNRCQACALPLALCICTSDTPADSDLHIILLRHPDEARRTSGTGNILLRTLKNCELLLPEHWDSRHGQGFDMPMALLFPPDGEDCLRDPNLTEMVSIPGLRTLIVPDGSWQETRRMVRKNKSLHSLPRVSLKLANRWLNKPLRNDKWERPCTAEAVGQFLLQNGEERASQSVRHLLERFVAAHWKARGTPLP